MEPPSISWIELAVALLCLLLVALTSATEGALAHVSRHKLRQLAEERRRDLRSVDTLFDNSRVYGAAMIILRTLAATAFVLLLADIFRREQLDGGFWALFPIAVVALLVVGQGLPRGLARQRPERVASRLLLFARAVAFLLRPLIALNELLLRGLVRLFSRSHPAAAEQEPEEDLHVLLGGEYGNGHEGVIEEDEREMIDAILQLEDRTARDIMVPRLDVVAVPETTEMAEVVETILRAGHSRVPVYSESIDQITGVLYAKDLLRFLPRDATRVSLDTLTRPVYIVPEAKRVDDLLQELQQRRVHMAIVVDEYGGTAGVVTIEDILEEIVGEIADEYDVATAPTVEQVSDRELLVDGRVSAEEVSDLLDLGWTEEEHNTLSGLVQRELEHLPVEGEEFDYDGVHITVLAVEGHRLKRLRVEKRSPDPGEARDGNGRADGGAAAK